MKNSEDFTNVPRRNYNGLYFNELFQIKERKKHDIFYLAS